MPLPSPHSDCYCFVARDIFLITPPQYLTVMLYTLSLWSCYRVKVVVNNNALVSCGYLSSQCSLTSCLPVGSVCRYHKIGLLVLFVHDVTDVCLEFTKVNVYFKNRGGKYYLVHEILSNIGFVAFAGAWWGNVVFLSLVLWNLSWLKVYILIQIFSWQRR